MRFTHCPLLAAFFKHFSLTLQVILFRCSNDGKSICSSHLAALLLTQLPVNGFKHNPEEFKLAFAKARFKLTRRDMGPPSRYIGSSE